MSPIFNLYKPRPHIIAFTREKMAFASNLKYLKGYLKRGAGGTIELRMWYSNMRIRRIPNIKTALNMVLSLSCPAMYNTAKRDVQYQQRIAKCSLAAHSQGGPHEKWSSVWSISRQRTTWRRSAQGSLLHSTSTTTGRPSALESWWRCRERGCYQLSLKR